MSRLLVTIAAIALSFAALTAVTSTAQAQAIIDSSTVENGYPSQLTFKLTAHSDSNITDVTLNYAITGRGTSAIGKPNDLNPDRNVSVAIPVQVNSQSSYIPVGSEFVYHWEITSADGSKFVGPDATFFYLPPNQDWKTVKGDFMTVYYHGDKQPLANAYLKAGVETYDKMATKLLKTTLEQVPVKVILFDDEKESSQARPPKSAKFDATTTTCGTKVTNDIVLVIPVSCGTADRTDTLRHEFTHIINETAGEGPFGKLPSWLDEGTAVYGQVTPGDNFTGAFDSAARGNRLIPFVSMATAPSDAALVNLFYGQAYTMAKYLVDKDGPATYAQFFANIKKGGRFEDALKQTYGFDLAGFEDEFRKANKVAPRVEPTAAPTQKAQPKAQATTVPTSPPANSNSGNSDSGGGISKATMVIIGVAVLFVLLAALSLLISMFMANNRTGGGTPGAPPPPSNE